MDIAYDLFMFVARLHVCVLVKGAFVPVDTRWKCPHGQSSGSLRLLCMRSNS